MRPLLLRLLLVVVSLLAVALILAELWCLPQLLSNALHTRVQEVQHELQVLSNNLLRQPLSTSTLQQLALHYPAGPDTQLRVVTLGPYATPPEPPPANVSPVYQALPDTPYQLVAWVDRSTIEQRVISRFRFTESLVCLSVLVTLLLLLVLQRRLLIKPMNQLIKVSESLAQGELNANLPKLIHRSILAPLTRSFTSMHSALVEQQTTMKRQIQARYLAEERLSLSHRIARLGCWEWLPQEQYFWVSDNLKTMLLLPEGNPDSVAALLHRVHPADRITILRKFQQMLEELSPGTLDFRISLPSGEYRHIHLISQLIPADHQEHPARLAGTCQDISERKQIESSLKKLSSAITYSGSSVMIIDIIGTIEYINPKYTETTGFSLQELKGTQPELLSRKWISPERYHALWQSIMAGKRWRGELQSRRKDGSSFWSLVSISPIHNEYDELTHFVIVCEDVTELKDAHAQMERLALYDELTGLPNRRLFFRKLAQLFDDDVQTYPSVVMLLDLDYFKTINDTQGHNVGDELLIQVAQRLKDTLRDEDIAARLGGDEFAILINPVTEPELVEVVAGKVLHEISRPFLINEHELQISTSLGMAWLPKDGHSPEALLKHADLAMYQAKEMGRNQYRFFTESLHDQLQTYIRFSREMPKALDSGGFFLEFQPQVDLKSSQIISMEALVRWDHSELGRIPPNQFIPVAEETGFIIPLGRWVLSKACCALRELSDQGYPDIRVAINLSSRQFRDPELLNMVRQSLHRYQIEPRRLELEITETLLMHDIDTAIDTLHQLRELGVSIAIDDFGIGYSSFNYLKTLPINVLKVDREFIKDIPHHLDDMEITAAIISMAHRLNKKVVAEGIETPIQRNFLDEHYCDVGQGYLFSKPVRLPDLQVLLAAKSLD